MVSNSMQEHVHSLNITYWITILQLARHIVNTHHYAEAMEVTMGSFVQYTQDNNLLQTYALSV